MRSVNIDGNYRPDLKGLRQRQRAVALIARPDGNYRPDLKGLRLPVVQQGDEIGVVRWKLPT